MIAGIICRTNRVSRNPIRVRSPVSIILIYRSHPVSVTLWSTRPGTPARPRLFVPETKLMAGRNYSYIPDFIKIERGKERRRAAGTNGRAVNAVFPFVRNPDAIIGPSPPPPPPPRYIARTINNGIVYFRFSSESGPIRSRVNSLFN